MVCAHSQADRFSWWDIGQRVNAAAFGRKRPIRFIHEVASLSNEDKLASSCITLILSASTSSFTTPPNYVEMPYFTFVALTKFTMHAVIASD
jgi:hypothetical protein